jgi:hypothetical protein
MISPKWLALAAVTVGLGILARPVAHDEDALLTDWSEPPPLPIFIAVNVLAATFRSIADALVPPPIRMLDLAYAYQTSVFVQFAQSFKIPDFLATGPKTVQEIMEYMETKDVLRVERLLYAMAADGITQLDKTSTASPRFVNTALSATLRSDHPNSIRGMVGHFFEEGYNAFGMLPQMYGPNAIDSVWDKTFPEFPKEKRGIWALYEAMPVREEQFGRAMWSVDGLGGKAMTLDGPFKKFDRFIDIGGSLGHFVYKLMSNYPDNNTQGVLFDRPPAIANAKKLWYEPSGSYNDGSQERLEMVEGDFFDASTIPEAKDGDVYLMRYILHDWNDEDCIKILSGIKSEMGNKKATLLIGECAIPNRNAVGVPSAIYHIDMHMMALFDTALGRTPEMWKELLSKAGFEFVAIHPTRSLIHWVEAMPLSWHLC